MKSRIPIIISAILCICLNASLASTSESQAPSPILQSSSGSTDYPWNMFHYGATRIGVTQASAPTRPVLQWNLGTGAPLYSSPIVGNGMVFATSYDGKLYAIDEYSGALKWSFATSGPIVGSPAVGYGRVFVASTDANVYALDESTGSLIWFFHNPNGNPITASSPVVADGKVFYGTLYSKGQGFLYALNATANAAPGMWAYTTVDAIRDPPSVLNGRVFFAEQGFVFAINETNNGALLWRSATGAISNTITAAPALAYGNVYVGTDAGGASAFYAFDQVTGAAKWSYNTNGFNSTTGAISNGIVYFGTGAGVLYAVNATTGLRIWQYPASGTLGTAISSSPAVSLGSNLLLFGASNHYMYALNLTSHTLLWRFLAGSVISSSPAVADGRVFFGAWDDKVYAVGSNSQLYATVTASPSSLQPRELSTLTIMVTNGTFPQTNVNITFSLSVNASISPPLMTTPGTYMTNFTSPVVDSVVSEVVTVTAAKQGYVSASVQATILLNPYPPLSVTVTPASSTVSIGADTVVKIQVLNGTETITGAAISLSASGGGSFSAVTDAGNGNYVAVYSAPLSASSIVLTATVQKSGFTTGQGNASLTVSPVPNPISSRVLGIPFALIIAGIVGLFVLFLLLIVSVGSKRRKSNPYFTPRAPSYVLDLRGHQQGFI